MSNTSALPKRLPVPTELTREQAIALAESKFWEAMTLRERAEFQLFQPLLCMPFPVFHEAMEHALGRPVFTHEFAYRDMLEKEFLGHRPKPSLADILAMIPAGKQVIVMGVSNA